MDRAWFARGVAAAGGRANRIHTFRFSAQQRLHLAAVLIALALALPAAAQQDDIFFDPDITDAQFREFSRVVAQGIYASPVQPAGASGLLRFDVGIAANIVSVDSEALYWVKSTGNDFSRNGYVAVPRLVVAKGFGGGTISGSYAKVNDSDVKTYGGSIDVPIVRGGIARPSIALRGVYSQLSGSDVFDLKAYGVEAYISKGFGPFTPYASVGRMRIDAHGRVPASVLLPPAVARTELHDESNIDRYTVGVRLSMFIPKIVLEATQGEQRSYAAKISIGL